MCFRDPGTEASRSWDKAACFLLFIPTVFLPEERPLGREKERWEVETGHGAVGGEGSHQYVLVVVLSLLISELLFLTASLGTGGDTPT